MRLTTECIITDRIRGEVIREEKKAKKRCVKEACRKEKRRLSWSKSKAATCGEGGGQIKSPSCGDRGGRIKSQTEKQFENKDKVKPGGEEKDREKLD